MASSDASALHIYKSSGHPKLRQAEALYSTRKTGQVLGPVQPGCLSRNEDVLTKLAVILP